jgi:PAS domain S-box-containing protein
MNQSIISAKIFSILQDEPQVQAEESVFNYLHHQKERITPDLLNIIWDRVIDGMLLTDSDGKIVAANTSLCILTGTIESQVVGQPFTVLFDESLDHTVLLDEYRGWIERNIPVPPHRESEIVFANGKRCTVKVLTSILADDADEIFVLTTYRDITRQKQWEESLRQNEQRFRSLFEYSILPMYQSNIEGNITIANKAMVSLLGYGTVEELQMVDIERDIYVNPEQRKIFFENLQSEQSHLPTELELKCKNGSAIFVQAYARILRDEQEAVIGFEGALENITDRKTMERQINSTITNLESTREELTTLNAQKDKILAIVSHDLRSPFGSILGFCDLLKNEFGSLSDNEKVEYINFIADAAKQQLDLVNSILDWSKLETGRIQVNMSPIDSAALASGTVTSLMGLAKVRNIAVQSTVPAETFIDADENLIRQVFQNLIGNALKFTPAGGSITIGLKENNSDRTILEISDTGIGIPKNEIERLFKIDEKYSRKGLQGETGTGLGLPICHEIMKHHHGSIDVRSEEGRGTTFLLTLPKAKKRTFRNILIVDDVKGNRMILSRFMKRISDECSIHFAETGREALAMLGTVSIDLILTDYHMPEMDGFEFIRSIRSSDTTKKLPVIMISGDRIEYYMQSNALTMILQKPVLFSQLKETIESFAHK